MSIRQKCGTLQCVKPKTVKQVVSHVVQQVIQVHTLLFIHIFDSDHRLCIYISDVHNR